MEELTFSTFNAVGTFNTDRQADMAVKALEEAGISREKVSVLSREQLEDAPEAGLQEEASDLQNSQAKGALSGSGAGAIVGGTLGLLAGAAAFGIPGIGPVVGSGIWAAVAGGTAAGATAGGLMGGFRKMWESNYLDALREGKVLVAVNSDDEDMHHEAFMALQFQGAESIQQYDKQGELIRST